MQFDPANNSYSNKEPTAIFTTLDDLNVNAVKLKI